LTDKFPEKSWTDGGGPPNLQSLNRNNSAANTHAKQFWPRILL